MKHAALSSQLIGICIKVHTRLGPGLLESLYEEVVCYELTKRGIPHRRQQGMKVIYDNVDMGIGYRADIIVEDKIIMELKSVQHILPVHHKTLLTYLSLSQIEVGLLINFNVAVLKDGIYRLVQDIRNNTLA